MMGRFTIWKPLKSRIIKDKEQTVVSIRAKLIFSFSIFFILCTTISVGSIWMLSEIENKIEFLEVANNFRVEIQQARRFEKNYLLYGTNLDDASDHMKTAETILSENVKTIETILGKEHLKTMVNYMAKYRGQINQLSSIKPDKVDATALRQYGSQVVEFAEEFVKKERDAVGRMLRFNKQTPIAFTIILVVLMISIFITFTRQLLLSLNRFMNYTKRIGDGDFSPIMTVKKDRDEFSKLADAFNQMVKELDNRHEILVQSHKLRAIGTLVAGVAHELNNPLNNSMLTASMFKEDFDTLSDSEKNEMIDDLIHETERSQRIVKDLLDFAREGETKIKPLIIEEIVNDSIRLVANQVKLAKVRLETDFDENLPTVHGDEQMLKQVFINLILNAVDALPAKGNIAVAIHKNSQPGYLTVEVSDNGPGIPEHIQSRIFEPFFTTKSKGKGVGLGLSVSKGIIRKLGGYIIFNSHPERGTAFSVAMPITDYPSVMMSENEHHIL